MGFTTPLPSKVSFHGHSTLLYVRGKSWNLADTEASLGHLFRSPAYYLICLEYILVLL